MTERERAMHTRREFLKDTGAAAASVAGLAVVPRRASGITEIRQDRPSMRPPPEERRFISPAVEAVIAEVRPAIRDPEMAWLFENCFPNTLDTTVDHTMTNGVPDTFVITGDIEAMWLRDSTAQVWPYLPLAGRDAALRQLLAGVVRRQTRCILIDPYANAFNKEPGESPWKDDLTDMKPELHERKWEVDSLCYAIRLADGYWSATGDASPFDADWRRAMRLVLRTFREQQRKDGLGPYRFQRVTGWQTDTVAGGGYGNPIRPVGLICSIFRPSDDATIYPFLVPSNFFAVRALRDLAALWNALELDENEFAQECLLLAREVEDALTQYARAEHLDFGTLFPYEVDGFGNRLFMDDANVPSLLSLPYLHCVDPRDPMYRATRAFVLSEHNPYFFLGRVGEGIGGPHAGLNQIWPLSIIMRGLTSDDDAEIAACLRQLVTTHAGTGFMHESFHKNDATRFTRAWFAWANTLFGEFILTVHRERPHLLGA